MFNIICFILYQWHHVSFNSIYFLLFASEVILTWAMYLRYAFLNLSFIYCSLNLLCSKILKCLHPSAVTPLTILWLGCLTPYDSNTFHLFKICNWQCFIPNYISMSRWLLFIKLCLSWSYCIAPGRRITYFHTNLLYSVLVQLESNNPQWVGEVNHDPKRFLSWSVRYRVIFHIFIHSFQFLTDCLKKSTTLLPCYLKNSCSISTRKKPYHRLLTVDPCYGHFGVLYLKILTVHFIYRGLVFSKIHFYFENFGIISQL